MSGLVSFSISLNKYDGVSGGASIELKRKNACVEGGRINRSRLILEQAELSGRLEVRPRSILFRRLGGKSLTREAVDIGTLS